MTTDEAKDYIREWCPYGKQDEIIKALSNSDEDCISRQAVLNILFYKSDGNSEVRLSKELRDRIKSLSSAKPQEPCDCISREFIEIVVNYPPADLCIYPEYKGKPYYSIKYRENGKEYVGFGTYKIEILSQWIIEYFMSDIQPKSKTDVLDKIRAEIADIYCSQYCENPYTAVAVRKMALEIIDKYKAEKA